MQMNAVVVSMQQMQKQRGSLDFDEMGAYCHSSCRPAYWIVTEILRLTTCAGSVFSPCVTHS